MANKTGSRFDVTDIDVTAIDGRYPAIVLDIDACARGSLSPAGVTKS